MSDHVRQHCRTQLKTQKVVIENVEANLTQCPIRNKDGDPVNLMLNLPRESQGHIKGALSAKIVNFCYPSKLSDMIDALI